ncbi:MAG: hypothetical protein IPL97_02750 [Niastella sp.]|nr:hypothetical protein [Niastella sp.]
MLKKLQSKWKVSGWRFALILITFTLGGSLCGWLGRKLLLLTGLEKNIGWFILYIILISLLWPICVIVLSIFTGQYMFFKIYIKKIFSRFSSKKKQKSQAEPA